MDILGQLEEFIADDLYPYRWPITAGLVVALIAVSAFAYHRGWHLIVWRNKPASAIVAAVVLAVAIPAGDYFLSPLWERSFLEEASPLAMVPDSTNPGSGSITHQGDFEGADDFHFGRGKALLVETEPGFYTLRFQEFSVRNGPDLFVYLAPGTDGDAEDALNLGELKATDGAFNYEVPPGTDISRFTHAIVWCQQFSVLFASALLAPIQ